MPAIATLEIRRGDGFVFLIDDRYAREGRSLVEGFEGLSRDPGVATVKRNMVRTVYRLERDGLPLFLKLYHSPGLLESLKSLVLPSRAAREWKAMHRLVRAGLPTARPVLFGERRRFGFLKRACFAATEIPGALDFGAFVERERAAGRWVKEARKALCGGLARLTAALHRAGVRHGDYHLGNILVNPGKDGVLELHLIDLHTVSFPARLTRADRVLNLARIAEVLSVLDDGEDLDDFLDAYRAEASDFAPSTRALRQEVDRRLARLNRRRLKSRTRRCLVESSEFTRARAEDFRMHVRRSCGTDLVVRAIRLHDEVEREGDPRLLHPVFKNKVTVVEAPFEDGMMRLCVKEYRPLPWWKRLLPFLSEARRSWIAGRGLEVRGIATPETVAWVRRGPLEYLVTRYAAEGEHLHRYIASRCADLLPRPAAKTQRALAREVAAFVKRMHDSGVRHGDLSEQNILVEEEEGRRSYFIIDCDTVTFGGPPGLRSRIKNLVQLGHMPEDVHVVAKARFLEHYLGGGRGAVWRSMFREIDRGILLRMIRKRRKFERLGIEDPHPIPSRFRGRW